MPPSSEEDSTGALERARKRLYEPEALDEDRPLLTPSGRGSLRHAWEENPLQHIVHPGKRRVRRATIFLIVTAVFFVASLGAAGYFFYYGGNSVSVDKVTVDVQGPTTISGGDITPLALTITNRNPVDITDATIEVDFPNGTLSADGSLAPYPRYVENVGTIKSGATVTRSVQATIFGGEGQALLLPITFSYGTLGSNASFAKKSSYALAISSTPLSVAVDSLSEAISGQPLTLTLTVRSNAKIPLDNVVLSNAFPFGFTATNSSIPLAGSTFVLGTMKPGTTRSITLTGTLSGQDGEQRVFHFSVGTAKSPTDPTLAVSYMTQDEPIRITAPFITTTLALNGDTSPSIVIAPGGHQSVVVSYLNTLTTSVTNANISITISGSGVDYSSIQSTSGFYNSTTHTIIFSRDTDPALAQLAPGASGVGAFTFTTLPAASGVVAPAATFTISVAGTRIGQSNVPENITASVEKTVKIATNAILVASALHSIGPITNTGPVPPHVGQSTTYSVLWNLHNSGSTIAGGTVSTILPSYVTYTGKTTGTGTFSYDGSSRTVTWSAGDLPQGVTVQAAFQVSFMPSTSQQGGSPPLTTRASFSGYDRFAGVQVSAGADPVTTETKGDPGYVSANAIVQ
ncbi:MAG: hypothetical protein RLZZ26_127 [Candidatus Parcubacteria bacterium]|jgi:hypothetical protein